MSNTYVDSLPRGTRVELDKLSIGLQEQLKEKLLAIIIHGSAARGEFREGRSNVDTLAIVSQVDHTDLISVWNVIALAKSAARIDTNILTEEEVTHGADVFPLHYEDIQKTHGVIFGSDPFETLVISTSHRRLRIEQVLRDAQLHIRKEVLSSRGSDKPLIHAVARKVRQLRFPFRALLELIGIPCPSTSLDAVMSRACKRFQVDQADLMRPDRQPVAAFNALSLLLARAIDVVDALEDADPPSVQSAE